MLQVLPEFATASERRRLLHGAMHGIPRAEDLVARLNLEGAPQSVAKEVILHLATFGEVAFGREVLGIFLNSINPLASPDDRLFIERLFSQYPLKRFFEKLAALDPCRPPWLTRATAQLIAQQIDASVTAEFVCELAKFYNRDTDETARYWIALALGKSGSPQAAEFLRAFLLWEDHPYPRDGIDQGLQMLSASSTK